MADRIIVLEQGQVVEQGTHEQLQSARGHYASLYELHTRSLTD
jgi:ABC-type multidrug transport system fused ATPase/permease subunit